MGRQTGRDPASLGLRGERSRLAVDAERSPAGTTASSIGAISRARWKRSASTAATITRACRSQPPPRSVPAICSRNTGSIRRARSSASRPAPRTVTRNAGHRRGWRSSRYVWASQGATCVLVGAAGDRDAGREIESALPRPARRRQSDRPHGSAAAGWRARSSARAFVSNDSGAMHLAAAFGVPVTAIFGPTDERVRTYRHAGDHDVLVHQVFCRPCMLRDCPIDHRCMKRISVDAVFDARRSAGRDLLAADAAQYEAGVFLDRDGTLIEEAGYLDRLERLVFFPYTVDAVRLLNRAGFAMVIVTNQAGVGRGIFDEPFVHDARRASPRGSPPAARTSTRFYYCPHHPEAAVPQYRMSCDCRKPAAGHVHAGGRRSRARSRAFFRRRRPMAAMSQAGRRPARAAFSCAPATAGRRGVTAQPGVERSRRRQPDRSRGFDPARSLMARRSPPPPADRQRLLALVDTLRTRRLPCSAI